MRINISITMEIGSDMNLTGKIAVVTGASSGIGRATAKLLAKSGARVVAGARRSAELERLVAEINEADGEAIALAGDVCSEDYARARRSRGNDLWRPGYRLQKCWHTRGDGAD